MNVQFLFYIGYKRFRYQKNRIGLSSKFIKAFSFIKIRVREVEDVGQLLYQESSGFLNWVINFVLRSIRKFREEELEFVTKM